MKRIDPRRWREQRPEEVAERTGGAVPTSSPRRGRRGAALRGGALFSLAALLGAGMVLGDRFEAEPTRMTDGTAWVDHGDDLVRGSAFTGRADAIVSGAGDGEASIAQDGSDTVVVVGGRAFTIDRTSLQGTDGQEVDRRTVPLVRGGKGYLISRGRVDCIDPRTGSTTGEPISTRGSTGIGTVDDQGVLWLAIERDGYVWKIEDCEVVREVKVFPAGHDVQVSLAGGRPVVYDETDGELTWLDRRTGEAAVRADVPAGGRLQGPSSTGDRAWITTDGTRLVGADRAGEVSSLDLEVGGLRRPEVVGDRVLVPSQAGGGQVVVVAAPAGKAPTREVVKPLPAATEEDFTSFIKDGQAWFSAPGAMQAGTIATDGEIEELKVDEEELKQREEQERPAPEELEVVAPPVSAPTTPTPGTTPAAAEGPAAGGPQVDQTSGTAPGGGGTPASVPAASTTSTTAAPRRGPVPNVVGQPPAAACAALTAAGFACQQAPLAGVGPSADQVVNQAPAGGSTADLGVAVRIEYYTDAGRVVPDVSSTLARSRSSACAEIEAAGLRCESRDETFINDAPNGGVAPGNAWAQDQPAGATLPTGSTVTITLEPSANLVWNVQLQQCRSNDPQDHDPVYVVRGGEPCPSSHPDRDSGSWARCSNSSGGGREPIYRLNPKAGALRPDGRPLQGTMVLAEESLRVNVQEGTVDPWDTANPQILCYAYFSAPGQPRSGPLQRAAIDNTWNTYAEGGAFQFLATQDPAFALILTYF